MKVFIAIIVVFGSVSARGSGPYLPSGWRPQGPAFYLPSEEPTPSDSPLKESLLQETEASGSDALREYGPPKLEEVTLRTDQGLPDIATQQSFAEDKKEGTTETEPSDITEQSTTETGASEESSTETSAQAIENTEVPEENTQVLDGNVEQSDAVPTVIVVEEITVPDIIDDVVTSNQDLVKEVLPTASEAAETLVEQDIRPIIVAKEGEAEAEEKVVPLYLQELQEVVLPTAPEAIVVLEEQEIVSTPVSDVLTEVNNNNEAPAITEQREKTTEEKADENGVISDQETAGTLEQAPVGFLEYGPPGFKEYGPPKQEDLLRGTADDVPSDNNEVRRRRFSPKLRSTKNH